MVEGSGRRLVDQYLRVAHAGTEDERQLLEYVAQLDLGERARILEASPTPLTACRVEAGEERSFEEVIRTWTPRVLSGVEGG